MVTIITLIFLAVAVVVIAKLLESLKALKAQGEICDLECQSLHGNICDLESELNELRESSEIYLLTEMGALFTKKGRPSQILTPLYPNGWHGEEAPKRVGLGGQIFRAPPDLKDWELEDLGWDYVGEIKDLF